MNITRICRPPGKAGNNGIDGENGKLGEPGATAKLDDSFTKPPSCVRQCPAGTPGYPGEPGPKGPQGDPGDDGSPASQANPGPQGT